MATPRPAAVELRDVPWSDVWESIRRASRFVSPKVGLAKTIQQGVTRAQDPELFSMGLGLQDLSRVSGILNSAKAGGGGELPEGALVATLGEAIERYCMLFYDKEEMVRGTARELAADAVDPNLIRYFSRRQIEQNGGRIGYSYFTEDSPTYWVWGTSLTSGKARLVPASQVYLNYKADNDEVVPGRNASTGLAAGTTIEEAILTGLFEVIERDCFTISWLHRHVGPRIAVDDPELKRVLEQRFYVGHPDVNLAFYDITLDIPIPAIFALMRRPAEYGPALCVTSVARLSMKEAIRKGLRELGQELPYLRYLRHQLADWDPLPDYSDVVTFDHHFTLYSKRPELIEEALAFCDLVEEEVPLSGLPDYRTGRVLGDIERCVAVLAEQGYEVIVVDITTEDVRELGWWVVRVLVPGMVPLSGNHNHPYLGLPRLREIADKLRWAENGWDPNAGLNPYPHPFP
jgi:ribosomal protein S12 methylthiotransferase accessory factor